MPNQPPRELIECLADYMQLRVSDPEMRVLQQVVETNEDYVATVDASDRHWSEDPLGFMRFMRTWRQHHGD